MGPYGLSLFTTLAVAAPAVAFLYPPRKARLAITLAVLPMIIAAAIGILRLGAAPAEMPTVPGVKLRLVQPNIPQREKWIREKQAEHFRLHVDLSADAASQGVTHILWPEAATAFLLLQTPDALAAIREIVPPGGALITGTPRRIDTPLGQGINANAGKIGNALVAIDDGGEVAAVYDKHHLVPFGEYVPFRQWLPVERLAAGRGDFAAGPGPQTLQVPGAPPFSPLVCYEAIFPGRSVGDGQHPSWLLNITNDAWFGSSAGPAQHLAIARLRAIEEGLPMARVASTGISAIIDPFGRIVHLIQVGQAGFIDAALPEATAERTIYARTGNVPFFAITLIGLLLSRFRFSQTQA